MYSIIAFIPARGGSKGIPFKNIKKIAGRPLIYWTLDAAVNSRLTEKVYVSTDSPEIRDVVESYGSPKIQVVGRSSGVSTDEAGTESVMLEFAQGHDFQHIALIQATSPLLTAAELDRGIEEYFKTGADSLLSVSVQKKFRWLRSESGFCKPANYSPEARPRKQDWAGELMENGALYITSRGSLLKSGCRLSGNIQCYVLPESHFIEIDTPDDWLIAEAQLKNYRRRLSEVPRNIKLVISDVDGVLTDAGMYYTENGDELKKFNTKDGMGFKILREKGIKTALITTENTKIVERRAGKLRIDFVVQGCWDKKNEAEKICEKMGISLDGVAFIGDDINDLDLLKSAGFSACPSDARKEVKGIVDYVCGSAGGRGCFRELVELIAEHRLA